MIRNLDDAQAFAEAVKAVQPKGALAVLTEPTPAPRKKRIKRVKPVRNPLRKLANRMHRRRYRDRNWLRYTDCRGPGAYVEPT